MWTKAREGSLALEQAGEADGVDHEVPCAQEVEVEWTRKRLQPSRIEHG
jgi:hypothetical protein